MGVEKECKLCGSYFTATRSNQIYCEYCGSTGNTFSRTQRQEARDRSRVSQSNRNKIITYNCHYCGKEHKAPKYLLSKLTVYARMSYDKKMHKYCCDSHLLQDLKDHSNCKICGKPLGDSEFQFNIRRLNNYCSEECKAKGPKPRGYFPDLEDSKFF